MAAGVSNQRQPTRQLTDPKGLGKPPSFSGVESEFKVWGQKTENYVLSVYPEARELLRTAAESLNDVDMEAMKTDPELPSEEIIDEVNIQVYSALMALTSSEPFDITIGAGAGNGLRHGGDFTSGMIHRPQGDREAYCERSWHPRSPPQRTSDMPLKS